MIRTNFHVTQSQLDALRRMSERTGLAVAELVRRAVDLMLAAEARKGGRK